MFDELCRMLNPGKPSFVPKREKTSVVMFVGLQGLFVEITCLIKFTFSLFMFMVFKVHIFIIYVYGFYCFSSLSPIPHLV